MGQLRRKHFQKHSHSESKILENEDKSFEFAKVVFDTKDFFE